MQKIFFKTFGCRTNIFDTQLMMSAFGEHQITTDEKSADVVIINSCTVTNGADSGVRSYTSKIKAANPNVRVLFTGCGLESIGRKLLDDGKIDGLFGHSEKLKANEFASSTEKITQIGNKTFIDDAIIKTQQGLTRAYIKVQEGCDFECSYCIIPSVRGKSRSIGGNTIINQVNTLVDSGFSEFILTGTNVGSFKELPKLILQIGNIKGVKRVRLGSIEPCQVSDELLDVIKADFFSKQLHVAIQHVDDDILEAMKRRNRFTSDLALFEKLAIEGFALGTDFIVGFPGESNDIWQESIKKILQLPLTHIHPFIFSPRASTLAANFNNAPKGDVSKERLKELNEIVAAKNLVFRQKQNDLLVLIEENGGGLDQFYNRCDIKGLKAKTWVKVNKFNVNEKNNEALEYKICNE